MSETLEKPKITAEIVKASFQLELSKLKYQEALQALVAYEVTRENVAEAQQKLKDARKFLAKFDDIKKKGKEEALAICRWWDDAYNGTKESFESELDVKAKTVNKIAAELAAEAQKAEAEKQRKAAILADIDAFFIAQSQNISNATNPQDLVAIEKLIGSHKANVSRYAEFLPLMGEKAANLTTLIKEQKEALKKLEALKTAEKAAEQQGDDQAVLDSREAQERIAQKIHETKIIVQERGINMSTNSDVVEVDIIAPEAPKARRSVWKWEVADIKTTNKKMPDWVKMQVDEDKVDEYLKAKKAEGIEGEEFVFAGIRFFLEKSY